MREFTLKGQKIISSHEYAKKRNLPKKMDFDIANGYLQDVKRVFDSAGIKFCLMYGTLLGAVRENDFLANDDDVDIALFGIDLDLISGALEELDAMGYYHCLTDACGHRNFGYVAKRETELTRVDMYVFFAAKDEYSDNLWFPRYLNNYHNKGPVDAVIPYPKHFFENMQEREFRGAKYRVPTPPEEFLEYIWGDGTGEKSRPKWWEATGGQYGIIQATVLPCGIFKDKIII